MRCGHKNLELCQPMPSSGPLASQMDTPLASLRNLKSRPVFVYVVTSLKIKDKCFIQTGCGPNFQGGRITLCTCKHKDRASPPPTKYDENPDTEPWNGVWVAGICSARQLRPRSLFFLMQVEEVFENNADAWKTLEKTLGKAVQAKSTHRSRFGDIYEPKSKKGCENPWDQTNYEDSIANHVHKAPTARYKDVEKIYHPNKHPKLLCGDPKHSYLWSTPKIRLKEKDDANWKSAHHRFYSWNVWECHWPRWPQVDRVFPKVKTGKAA